MIKLSDDVVKSFKEVMGYERTGEYSKEDIVTCKSRTPDPDHNEPFKFLFILQQPGHGNMSSPGLYVWNGISFVSSGISVEDVAAM